MLTLEQAIKLRKGQSLTSITDCSAPGKRTKDKSYILKKDPDIFYENIDGNKQPTNAIFKIEDDKGNLIRATYHNFKLA